MWPWTGRRKELERAGSLRTPDVPGVPRGGLRTVLREARVGVGVGLSCGAPVLRYNRGVGWEQVITVVLAVLVAVLYNNRRFDDVNRRFDDVHRRIDDLRADMNARFAQMDARFAEVHARLSELREDLREIRGMLQTTPKIATRFLGTPVPLR
jgi:hypothetical protein